MTRPSSSSDCDFRIERYGWNQAVLIELGRHPDVEFSDQHEIAVPDKHWYSGHSLRKPPLLGHNMIYLQHSICATNIETPYALKYCHKSIAKAMP